MSRVTELAAENAVKSTLRFVDDHTIEVCDGVILWPDFSGRVTDYHPKKGEKRSFNLVLNASMIQALSDLQEQTGVKFRIHQANIYSEMDVKEKGVEQKVLHYINVKVNMDNDYPPTVTLFTNYNGKRSRVTLNRETIDTLDSTDIESCDMLLNCYVSRMHRDQCSAYLKKLNVIQNKQVEFGGKYDDWEDAGMDGEPVNTASDIVNSATGE